jgi:hypothetical protein
MTLIRILGKLSMRVRNGYNLLRTGLVAGSCEYIIEHFGLMKAGNFIIFSV